MSKLWSNPQRLELNRREVFGPDLLPDPTRNGPPNAMVYLEISHLRLTATRALQRMNLTPAWQLFSSLICIFFTLRLAAQWPLKDFETMCFA